MQDNLTPAVFLFQDSHNIRTLTIDGEPWFVAKDIAEVLGYGAPRNAIKQHCKGALKRCLPSASGNQEHYIIPERDLYRLIMRSKLPSAERFEEWVVSEVLPSIRKTGSYSHKPLNTTATTSDKPLYASGQVATPPHGSFKHTSCFIAGHAINVILHDDRYWLDIERIASLLGAADVKTFLEEHKLNWCMVELGHRHYVMAPAGSLRSIAVTNSGKEVKKLVEALDRLLLHSADMQLQPQTITPTVTLQPPQTPSFPPVPNHTDSSIDLRNNSLIAGVLMTEQSREQLHLLYGHYLGARELGYIIGCSEASANRILFDRGLHEHGDNGYQVTDKGRPYAMHIDVGGIYPNRQAKRIIKWHSSIIPIIAAENLELQRVFKARKPSQQRLTLEEKPLSVNTQTAIDALLAKLKYRSFYDQQPIAAEVMNLVCQFSGPGTSRERWCEA